MLTLGLAGVLLDIELVVHSDRRKRERPTREAEALKSIGDDRNNKRDKDERHAHVHGHTMPGHLLIVEVSDATRNWWNATHFLEPKSARRWARLWGNHALRDRECPIPKTDPEDVDEEGSGDSDVNVGPETEPDDNDDTEGPCTQEVQTVRAWRKRVCTAALTQQHAAWFEQRKATR